MTSGFDLMHFRFKTLSGGNGGTGKASTVA